MKRFFLLLLPMLVASVAASAQLPASSRGKAYMLYSVGENERLVAKEDAEFIFVAFGEDNIGVYSCDDSAKKMIKHLTKNRDFYGEKAISRRNNDNREWKIPESPVPVLFVTRIESIKFNAELSNAEFTIYRGCERKYQTEQTLVDSRSYWTEPAWLDNCYMFHGMGEDMWILSHENPSRIKHYKQVSVDEILDALK